MDTFFTTAVSLCVNIVLEIMLGYCWAAKRLPKKKDLGFLTAAPDDHNFEFFVYVAFKVKGGRYLRFPAPFKSVFMATRHGMLA